MDLLTALFGEHTSSHLPLQRIAPKPVDIAVGQGIERLEIPLKTYTPHSAGGESRKKKSWERTYVLEKIITAATKMPAPRAKRLYLLCSVSA